MIKAFNQVIKTTTNINLQQPFQEPVMPDRVKSFFEIYKTSVDLFVVIMTYLSIEVRRVKTWFAVRRLLGKKPI